MAYKVVLSARRKREKSLHKTDLDKTKEIKKSLVKVFFISRDLELPYYNDRFDLQKGDRVYVSGKLYGHMGIVTEVNYCFKIKLSDYERVTALVDTTVKGEFYGIGSDFITFAPGTLPYKKVHSWLKPPEHFPVEYACGSESKSFSLEELPALKLDEEEKAKGEFLFENERVRYLAVCGTSGKALVVGSKLYEIEFRYENGRITNLFCSCYETGYCGHSLAVMLKLRQILDCIEKDYEQEYKKSGCFCVVNKVLLLNFSVKNKEKGKIIL